MNKTLTIIDDVLTTEESQNIVHDLVAAYPEIIEKNLHLKIDDRFKFLDYIPNLYIPDLKHQIGRYVVTMNTQGWYAGDAWHSDGADNELTFLLYLSGDNSAGGDLLTEDSTSPFKLNSLFIFNSSVSHYVTPYSSNVPRIAFKWRYTM